MKKISLVMMAVFALNANVTEEMIPEVVNETATLGVSARICQYAGYVYDGVKHFSLNVYSKVSPYFAKAYEKVSVQVKEHPYITTGIVLGVAVAVASTYFVYKYVYNAAADNTETVKEKEVAVLGNDESSGQMTVQAESKEIVFVGGMPCEGLDPKVNHLAS